MKASWYTFNDSRKDQDVPLVDYDAVLGLTVSNIIVDSVPLSDLRDNIRMRHPDMLATQAASPDRPQSLGLGQFVFEDTNIDLSSPS